MTTYMLSLTGRELAILGAVLSRCEGWDDPRELARFVNIHADDVRDGFTDTEMLALHEHLASALEAPSLLPLLHTAVRLAKEATNGWACYAKRKAEHDNIAHLHREIAQLERDATTKGDGQT